MSKANWVNVNPASGSGNKTVSVTSVASNTGRNSRSTTLTITAADCEDVSVAVNQAGRPEYVVNNSETATATKQGQTVTISGKSNSSKLTFSIGATGNTLGLVAPESYTAGGVSTANGAAIVGDPGANQEYNWSVQFIIPINDTIDALSAQVIVTDDAGHTSTCTITQAAGDAYLTVSVESVDLGWEGTTAVSFNVSSNTSWTIS